METALKIPRSVAEYLTPGLFWLVEPSDMRPYRDYNTALRHLIDLKRLGWQARIENSEGEVLCD